MNNSGAIYVAHPEPEAVANAIRAYLTGQGFREADYAPGSGGRRIMIPDKRIRLFFVVPPHNGWVTIWEDPGYFGERALARTLARTLATRTVWIEVSGNEVGWCYGLYDNDQVMAEVFDPMDTTFYGEYGTIHFAFHTELLADEFIAQHGLPYDELHYEAALAGELPAEAGAPIHISFVKK